MLIHIDCTGVVAIVVDAIPRLRGTLGKSDYLQRCVAGPFPDGAYCARPGIRKRLIKRGASSAVKNAFYPSKIVRKCENESERAIASLCMNC